MELKLPEKDIPAAIAAGHQLAEARLSGLNAIFFANGTNGVPLRLTAGGNIQSLERFLDDPKSIRSKVILIDVDSFVTYVNRYKTTATQIFANATAGHFTAILDYPEKDAPHWARHIVELNLSKTPEFLELETLNKKLIDQDDFVEWIENNPTIFRHPPYADLLEIARTLQAANNVEFESKYDSKSGIRTLVLKETSLAKAGQKYDMEIPSDLVFLIEPFKHGEAMEFPARFRFRTSAGLKFAYVLTNPEKIIEAAVELIAERIVELTKIEVLYGVPTVERETKE